MLNKNDKFQEIINYIENDYELKLILDKLEEQYNKLHSNDEITYLQNITMMLYVLKDYVNLSCSDCIYGSYSNEFKSYLCEKNIKTMNKSYCEKIVLEDFDLQDWC